MPMAGYPDFSACVRSAAARKIDDPQAYCGAIKARVEGAAKNTLVHFLNDTLNVFRLTESNQALVRNERVAVLEKLYFDMKEKKYAAEALSEIQMSIDAIRSGDRDAASHHLEQSLSLLKDPDYPLPNEMHELAYTAYHLQDAKKLSDTFYLDDVEVFKVGVWNGDKYSIDDLKKIEENFRQLKETVKPPIKLGHPEDQKLLQQEGLPAAGWVDKLSLMGDKLIASIRDVPRVIYDLVKNRAYKRVSSEIYPNYKDGQGKAYGPVLRAVAFLGGDIPAVDSLEDVQALYGQSDQKTLKYFITADKLSCGDEHDDVKKYPPKTFIIQGVRPLQARPKSVNISKSKLAFSMRVSN